MRREDKEEQGGISAEVADKGVSSHVCERIRGEQEKRCKCN